MSHSRVLSVAKDVEDTKDNKFEESITERAMRVASISPHTA